MIENSKQQTSHYKLLHSGCAYVIFGREYFIFVNASSKKTHRPLLLVQGIKRRKNWKYWKDSTQLSSISYLFPQERGEENLLPKIAVLSLYLLSQVKINFESCILIIDVPQTNEVVLFFKLVKQGEQTYDELEFNSGALFTDIGTFTLVSTIVVLNQVSQNLNFPVLVGSVVCLKVIYTANMTSLLQYPHRLSFSEYMICQRRRDGFRFS